MTTKLNGILGKIHNVLREPRKAMVLYWMRVFPFCRIPDPEAYRLCTWIYGRIPRVPINQVFPGIHEVDIVLRRTFDRVAGTSLDVVEVAILSAIVRFTGARNILEIGTYDGNTALNLASNSPPDARITTVDLPPDWSGRFELPVPHIRVNVTEGAKVGLQFKDTELSEKITQVLEDSAKIDWSQMPIPFDLAFVDGCHYYDYVRTDTENAIKYLKPGGILVWHDYGMRKDVSRVVDETAQTLRVYAIRGTRLAVGFVD